MPWWCYMASIAKPWFIFLFVVKPRLIYIHKGTYVIKTLCNWAQKWTWVILTDAEITVASLNSLHDLAFYFIIVMFVFFYCREANKSNMCAVRVSTVIHSGQKHTRNALWRNIIGINIRTGLVFSENHWVCWKTVGNLLWNYYRSCVWKTQMWQIRTRLK